MYVPPFEAILTNLNLSKDEFSATETVAVPPELLKFLLRLALVNSDFNESAYLAANPDVASANKKGTLENPRMHYIGDGYFEGRQGGEPNVDEQWYLKAYPDVAKGIQGGIANSAMQHFRGIGARELRAPSEAYVDDAVQWGKAFGKT